MLNEIIRITSSEPYKSSGGMRVKEISIKPWDSPNAKMGFDIWIDDEENKPAETWEVTFKDLYHTNSIPQSIIPRTQFKVLDDHPVLWNLQDQVFFSLTGKASNIPAILGELFIEHTKACGNWVEFSWLYGGIDEILETLRENQLAIPICLKTACFQVLERHGLKYRINSIQEGDKGYKVLLFSNEDIWPDDTNFKQSYIIAKEFSERRLM